MDKEEKKVKKVKIIKETVPVPKHIEDKLKEIKTVFENLSDIDNEESDDKNK